MDVTAHTMAGAFSLHRSRFGHRCSRRATASGVRHFA